MKGLSEYSPTLADVVDCAGCVLDDHDACCGPAFYSFTCGYIDRFGVA